MSTIPRQIKNFKISQNCLKVGKYFDTNSSSRSIGLKGDTELSTILNSNKYVDVDVRLSLKWVGGSFPKKNIARDTTEPGYWFSQDGWVATSIIHIYISVSILYFGLQASWWKSGYSSFWQCLCLKCACRSFELESGRLCSLSSTSLWILSILHGSSWGGKLIFSLVPLETANKCRRVHNLEQNQKLQIRKISVKENDMFRDSKTVQTRLFLAFLPTPTEGGAALFQPS